MHVLSVVGARPQFVKAAAFSRACADAGVTETIIHTGQHYDSTLSDVFFQDLGIPEPWMNLGAGSSSASRQIADILVGLESALNKMDHAPDWVVVFGDTNSTIAAGLAVVKKGFRLAHAEAGLRSFNRAMPEEVNRVMVDRISNLLFCPNSTAVENLRAEGITEGVFEVGDLMLDALRLFAPVARAKYDPAATSGVKGPYFLVTLHRAENTDDQARLRSLLDCLSKAPLPLVWPIHPRTRNRISEYGLDIPGRIALLEPVGYPAMLSLIAHAEMVLTDSGGVQREAYWMERPCITMRNETEWPETLHGNWNQLVGADAAKFVEAIAKRPVGKPVRPSSDGFAGERMIRVLQDTPERR